MSEEPDEAALMQAAALVIQARMGDTYVMEGCEPHLEEDPAYWDFFVKEKDKPRMRAEEIRIRHDVLVKVAGENLDMDHIKGKKPLPEQIREQMRQEFGDGLDSLFEDRES